MKQVFPNVAVLLATYNGEDYLAEQLDSIYAQVGVSVTVYVRDDGSTDATVSILDSYSTRLGNLVLLTGIGGGGSAAQNFKEIILELDTVDFSCVCFADQDDIWLPNKLENALKKIDDGCDLYSSSLTAFREGVKETDIIKERVDFKEFDYLFQGLSAGCTYVLSPSFFAFVRNKIADNKGVLDVGFSHDWLIYTIARSYGYDVYHDDCSGILYRQHAYNVQGSLVGVQGVIYRFKNIWEHWYYNQIMFNTSFIKNTPDERSILNAVKSKRILFLIKNCFKFRRGYFECLALLFFLILRNRHD